MKHERTEQALFKKATREAKPLGREEEELISLRKNGEGKDEFYNEAEGEES